jgi:hypothetical protein
VYRLGYHPSAFQEAIVSGNFSTGLLVGLAVGAGAALVGTDRWQSARPLAKGAIRAALIGFAVARRAAVRAAEDFEDLVAETMHEMEGEASPLSPGGGTNGG